MSLGLFLFSFESFKIMGNKKMFGPKSSIRPTKVYRIIPPHPKRAFFCFKKYASDQIFSERSHPIHGFFCNESSIPPKNGPQKISPSGTTAKPKGHLKEGIPNPLSRIHGTIVWYGIFTVQVPKFGQFVWVFIIGKNTIVPWESVLGFGGRAEASQVTYPGSTPATVSFVPRILPTVGGGWCCCLVGGFKYVSKSSLRKLGK